MCDIFHQETFTMITNVSSKLRTYSKFKKAIGFETYLTNINNVKNRVTLTKFRLSNHTLMIEKGRHQGIDKNLRCCPFCPYSIKDEMHFLMECICFTSHRKQLFATINETFRKNNIQYQNKQTQFITLLSNIDVIPFTAKYLAQTLYVNFLLQNHKNFI